MPCHVGCNSSTRFCADLPTSFGGSFEENPFPLPTTAGYDHSTKLSQELQFKSGVKVENMRHHTRRLFESLKRHQESSVASIPLLMKHYRPANTYSNSLVSVFCEPSRWRINTAKAMIVWHRLGLPHGATFHSDTNSQLVYLCTVEMFLSTHLTDQ